MNLFPKFRDEWARNNGRNWEAVEKQLWVARTHIKDGKENIPNTQIILPALRENGNAFPSQSKNK